jgi:hypothetical protein
VTSGRTPPPSSPFIRSSHRSSQVPWDLAVLDASKRRDLVGIVANHIALNRMASTPAHFAAWRRAIGGEPYEARERRAILAFLSRGLGKPTAPGNQDHLEGLIAEHLWHIANSQFPADEPVLYLSNPKFDPTAPGADGLVIFDRNGPRFRLWEIKKAGAHVSATLSKAYDQLSRNADVYLAQMTAIGQEQGNPDLVDVFAQILDWWLDGSEQACVGVAIASPLRPTSSFSTMRTRLSMLTAPEAHRGLFVSIGDYPGFCADVRTLLWTGL